MTTYYLDSSALVKRYVSETGSGWVQALCDSRSGHVMALAHIGLVEVAAALVLPRFAFAQLDLSAYV